MKNENYLKELKEESKKLSKDVKENEHLSEKYITEINELNKVNLLSHLIIYFHKCYLF